MKESIVIEENNIEPKEQQLAFVLMSKVFLVFCLLLLVSSSILADYFSDFLLLKIRDLASIDGFFHSRGVGLNRFLLFDIIIDLGFLTVVLGSLARWPLLFFRFNYENHQSWFGAFTKEFFIYVFTSIILMLFFAISQGLLWWLPRELVGLYLHYYKGVQHITISLAESKRNEYFNWLHFTNISLILIFLIRIGIITKIISLLINPSEPQKNNPLIPLILLPLIFLTASLPVFSDFKKYHQTNKTENKKEETSVPQDKSKPTSGKLHIEIYDPATGETVTNDQFNQIQETK